MKQYLYQLLASAGLALVLVPSFLHFLGRMENEQMKTYIFLGTMIWFAGAIPWLGRKKKSL